MIAWLILKELILMHTLLWSQLKLMKEIVFWPWNWKKLKNPHLIAIPPEMHVGILFVYSCEKPKTRKRNKILNRWFGFLFAVFNIYITRRVAMERKLHRRNHKTTKWFQTPQSKVTWEGTGGFPTLSGFLLTTQCFRKLHLPCLLPSLRPAEMLQSRRDFASEEDRAKDKMPWVLYKYLILKYFSKIWSWFLMGPRQHSPQQSASQLDTSS